MSNPGNGGWGSPNGPKPPRPDSWGPETKIIRPQTEGPAANPWRTDNVSSPPPKPEPQYGSFAQPPAPEPTGGRSGSSGLVIGSVVGTLAVIGAIALLAWAFGAFDKDDQGTQDIAAPPTTSAPATTSSSPSSAPSSAPASRPAQPNLPAGASPVNDAAISGQPAGNFNNVYLSGPTSAEFANNVREAYARNFLQTKQYNAVINAYSPVTHLNYTMDCRDNGQWVTCRGGNDAVVYIA
ncbi:hypothetical protein [Corynebacterium heidelbergense]|uniref:hypothetical protein n=1 Tax=Corynebacterium heidelbergense TaxID=2055947 RepID=UPI001EE6F4ED|nr:hypothetical protein [Corynebacterium heidelbergense]